jgi:hypothetical protein
MREKKMFKETTHQTVESIKAACSWKKARSGGIFVVARSLGLHVEFELCIFLKVAVMREREREEKDLSNWQAYSTMS